MGQSIPYRVVLTADGSNTVYSEVFKAHYHSIHGAVTESLHVFIDAGLRPKLKTGSEISVLEVGLGTGLNALLTYCETVKMQAEVRYSAIEKYLLPPEIYHALQYAEYLKREDLAQVFQQIHQRASFTLSGNKMAFHFQKLFADLHALDLIPGNQDLIYYDAFAPSSQEDMWTAGLLKKMYDALNPEGILVTYCAKGQFRRDLQAQGFTVERIPGPPGKREMIRAVK